MKVTDPFDLLDDVIVFFVLDPLAKCQDKTVDSGGVALFTGDLGVSVMGCTCVGTHQIQSRVVLVVPRSHASACHHSDQNRCNSNVVLWPICLKDGFIHSFILVWYRH